MKIIFSRKGFDSGSGGVPSPIFRDGRMLSLPIPDIHSPIQYQDIIWNEYNLGEIVLSLTNGKIAPTWNAHLDPDLNIESINRLEGWKPVLGQTAAAQGHLQNNDIVEDDVFLFFGLFREILVHNGLLLYNRYSPKKHIIWGWLQIGEILRVGDHFPQWLNYHPHCHGNRGPNNTFYIAKKSGVFSHYAENLQLTAPNQPDGYKTSVWQLPGWMYPIVGRTPLTYHGNRDRWNMLNDNLVQLESVGKGQEFVLDCDEYPEALEWLRTLIN